jgi:hypothetical protein
LVQSGASPSFWSAVPSLITAGAGLIGANQADKANEASANAITNSADAAAATASKVADAQIRSMEQNDALAAEYADYNRTTFRPLEKSIVADAEGYDTPEKRNAAALAAQADVNKGFAAKNAATARTLASNGVNPASTRAMSVMEGDGVNQALGGAAAAYAARKGVETTGFARKLDAASLGRNLPSAQATSAQIALQAGNGAVNNTLKPVDAYSTAALTNNRVSNSNNAAWTALGGVAGQWAGSKPVQDWFSGLAQNGIGG